MIENNTVNPPKKNIFERLAQDCAVAFRQFPLAYIFLVACVLVYSCQWQFNYLDDFLLSEIGLSLLLASVGSLAASLCTRRLTVVWKVAAQVLSAVIAAMFLSLFITSGILRPEVYAESNSLAILCSLIAWLGIVCGLILYPFWYRGENKVILSWSTTMRGLTGVFRAALVAFCVFAAMGIITMASEVLLGVTVFGPFWLQFLPQLILGALTIAAFSSAGTRDEKPFRLAPFSRGVYTFLFVPLEAIYLLIFYLYLIGVLCGGTNPVRDIVWQAIGLFAVFCVQRYIFTASVEADDNVVVRWFNRLSPWLLIAPVVMMSWSICTQLADYGLTVNRGYVLVANIWMYGVIIWWIVTGTKKIWVMPVSLWILVAVVSLPVGNICDITEWSMQSRLRRAMEGAGWQLPVSESFYKDHSKELTADDRSTKKYLENNMGAGTLKGLVTFPITENKEGKRIMARSRGEFVYLSARCRATFSNIPAGCTAICLDDFPIDDVIVRDEKVILTFGDDTGTITFIYSELEKLDDAKKLPVNSIRPISVSGKIKGTAISGFSLTLSDGTDSSRPSGRITGTLFVEASAANFFTND